MANSTCNDAEHHQPLEKQNQKHKEIHPIYPLDKLKFKNHPYYKKKKNLAILSPSEDVKQLQLIYFGQKCYNHLGKSYGNVWIKFGRFLKTSIYSYHFSPVILQLVNSLTEKKANVQTKTCIQIFIAVLFVIAKNHLGKSKYSSTVEQTSKCGISTQWNTTQK